MARHCVLLSSLSLLVLLVLSSCLLDVDFGHSTGGGTTGQTQIWTPDDYVWPDTPEGLFGYESLPEAMQSFYRDLYSRCVDFANGGPVSKSVTMTKFEVSKYGLSVDDMASVWNMFCFENPRFYWLAHQMNLIGSSYVTLEVVDKYQDESTRVAMDLKLKAFMDSCQKKIHDANAVTDLEKALVIHDFLLDSIEYAYTTDGEAEESEWAHSIEGAIDKGKGVCETYAKAFHLLCTANGVETLPVLGKATEGSSEIGHAWNLMKIGSSWYGVDVTWDDADPTDHETHLYFGADDDLMKLRHTPNTTAGEGVNYYFDLPAVSEERIAMVYLIENGSNTRLHANMDEALNAMVNPSSSYEIILYPYAIGQIKYGDTLAYDSSDLFHVTSGSSPVVRYIDIRSINSTIKVRHVVNFDQEYRLYCNIYFSYGIKVNSNGFTGKYQASYRW